MVDSTVLGSYFLTPADDMRGMVLRELGGDRFEVDVLTRYGSVHVNVRAADTEGWVFYTSLNAWKAEAAKLDLQKAINRLSAGEFSRGQNPRRGE